MFRCSSLHVIATRLSIGAASTLGLGCQPPEQIEPGASAISSPVPVVSVRAGEALVVWHRAGYQLRASSRFEGGASWTAPIVIGSGRDPAVALSSSGNAFVVSRTSTGAGATVRTAGVWSPMFALDSGSSGYVTVGADSAGNALAAWSRDGIRAALYQNGSGWQPPVLLSAVGSIVKAAMNEAGSAIVGFCMGSQLAAITYDPAAGWSTTHTTGNDCCLPYTDVVAPGISVAMSESGAAYAVGALGNVCELHRSAAGTWSSSVLDTVDFATAPQVAASVDGRAVVAWLRSESGGRSLKVRAFVPATGWGPLLAGPSGIGAGPIGVGYGSGSGAAITYRGGLALRFVVYNSSTNVLGSPGDVKPATTLAEAPYFIYSGTNPLEPAQGVTVWQKGGGEEIWAARLGI